MCQRREEIFDVLGNLLMVVGDMAGVGGELIQWMQLLVFKSGLALAEEVGLPVGTCLL